MPLPGKILPTIQGALQQRKLAALTPTPADKAHFASRLFTNVKAVDPSKWKECDLSSYKSPIRDQATHGSCTGHAGVTALDIVRRQMGQTPVLLSCTFPYSLVNGGQDNGASVSSILRVLEQVGTCTFDECGTDQIFPSQYNVKQCTATAKQYQAVQAFLCHTFEELCEAINQGYPVAFGIQIGNNFNNLSPEGVCPPPRMTIGGHALCGVGLKRSQAGDWLIKFQNSWTAKWGLGGYAYLSRGSFANMVDGYAIMYAENNDGPPPPQLKKDVDGLESLRDQAMAEIFKEEDQKFLDAVNKADEAIKVVPQEESLTAQLQVEGVKKKRSKNLLGG